MSELHGHALVDRAWRGYHLRATIPWFVFGIGVDIFVLVGRWYLDDLPDTAHRVAAIGAYVAALVGSSLLVAALLYRTIHYTYRLTDRALLIDKGFLSQYLPPIWLNEIATVKARTNWVERQLGVGRVYVTTEAGQSIRMTGVREPEEFASMIRAGIAPEKREGKDLTPPPVPPQKS